MLGDEKLPWLGLLALTLAGFIAIMTETMPAGLLPQISHGIGVSEALAGQMITAYAIGSVMAAIPVISLTQSWRRRPLLLIAISGFFVFNLATAFVTLYPILLVVRFFAGAAAGIIWGLLTGYTLRMVPEKMAGKALAVVGVGQPIALSLGVPLGTWLGDLVGWNFTFLIMSALSFLLLFWVQFRVPDFKGNGNNDLRALSKIFKIKGVVGILLVTTTWILAHNTLYTYIASFLKTKGIFEQTDVVLFVFGIFSIFGIWTTGLLIDRWLRKIVIASLLVFTIAGFVLFSSNNVTELVYVGVALWGIAFGGAPILLQKELADKAGKYVDVSQSVFVTVFNLAVAFGGIVGGVLLENFGVEYILLAFIAMSMLGIFIHVRIPKE